MTSAVGAVNIASVQTSAVVQLGDAVLLSPSCSSKSYAGAGSFLTGGVLSSNSLASATATNDPDAVDVKSASDEAGPNTGEMG